MMSKKKTELVIINASNASQVDEKLMFSQVAEIIENRKYRAGACANREVTLMYWEVGKYISSVLTDGERAEYGKRILATLSQQLVPRYGKSFEYTKVTRMIKFAKLFPDIDILATLSQELSWSHFMEIFPVKSEEARIFAQMTRRQDI